MRIEIELPGEDIVVNQEPDLHASLKDIDVERLTREAEVEPERKHLVVAIDDAFETARRRLQEQFEVPRAYADAGEMLREERLDIVSVCLWHPLHAEYTALAARHRPRAIICEKPMATCLAEADAMLATCAEHGVKLAIGHQRRFNQSWTRARELVAAGKASLPLLRDKLTVKKPVDKETLRLIAELADERFPVRQAAEKKLRALGKEADEPLRAALEKKPALEAARRIVQILAELEKLGLPYRRVPGGPLAEALGQDEHDVRLCLREHLLGEEHELHLSEAVEQELAHRGRVVHRQELGGQDQA